MFLIKELLSFTLSALPLWFITKKNKRYFSSDAFLFLFSSIYFFAAGDDIFFSNTIATKNILFSLLAWVIGAVSGGFLIGFYLYHVSLFWNYLLEKIDFKNICTEVALIIALAMTYLFILEYWPFEKQRSNIVFSSEEVAKNKNRFEYFLCLSDPRNAIILDKTDSSVMIVSKDAAVKLSNHRKIYFCAVTKGSSPESQNS